MLTAIVAALVVLLAAALFVVWRLWRDATAHVAEQGGLLRRQCQEMNNLRAELDALSICGPAFDPIHGSHDRLPIRDDIRATLTAYCEGMWQHTANGDAK